MGALGVFFYAVEARRGGGGLLMFVFEARWGMDRHLLCYFNDYYSGAITSLNWALFKWVLVRLAGEGGIDMFWRHWAMFEA